MTLLTIYQNNLSPLAAWDIGVSQTLGGSIGAVQNWKSPATGALTLQALELAGVGVESFTAQGTLNMSSVTLAAHISPVLVPTTTVSQPWYKGLVVQCGAEAGNVVQSGSVAGTVAHSGSEAGSVV